jgi:acyl-CoA oxidase
MNHMDAIVTTYGLTEYELDSALARSNPTPYEALFEGAKNTEMSGMKMLHLWPVIVDTKHIWKKINEDTDDVGVTAREKL